MPSHDAEEFGGELYHDIIARIERSWGIWKDTLNRVDESDANAAGLARSLMDETAAGDEAAVETIRALLEDSTYQTVASPDDVTSGDSFSESQQAMTTHHDRLLGAIEGASQASNDVLEAVREEIGPQTWQRYEDRAARLRSATAGAAGGRATSGPVGPPGLAARPVVRAGVLCARGPGVAAASRAGTTRVGGLRSHPPGPGIRCPVRSPLPRVRAA